MFKFLYLLNSNISDKTTNIALFCIIKAEINLLYYKYFNIL